jgi:hypothetical protein
MCTRGSENITLSQVTTTCVHKRWIEPLWGKLWECAHTCACRERERERESKITPSGEVSLGEEFLLLFKAASSSFLAI